MLAIDPRKPTTEQLKLQEPHVGNKLYGVKDFCQESIASKLAKLRQLVSNRKVIAESPVTPDTPEVLAKLDSEIYTASESIEIYDKPFCRETPDNTASREISGEVGFMLDL